ncbi:MAG: hypothetical protein CL678_03540 [Bdellovibrionaceae bacterium]|nr:hypothetical protein [Pseudobdellovibrionaceae bacterium]|tara:strand:+ start:442 stop:1032 length:591 start_codon:yes stop_codon:yes gene_type:complete
MTVVALFLFCFSSMLHADSPQNPLETQLKNLTHQNLTLAKELSNTPESFFLSPQLTKLLKEERLDQTKYSRKDALIFLIGFILSSHGLPLTEARQRRFSLKEDYKKQYFYEKKEIILRMKNLFPILIEYHDSLSLLNEDHPSIKSRLSSIEFAIAHLAMIVDPKEWSEPKRVYEFIENTKKELSGKDSPFCSLYFK